MLEGVSVLLVDDNSTNRLVARTMLTRLGARVDERRTGLPVWPPPATAPTT